VLKVTLHSTVQPTNIDSVKSGFTSAEGTHGHNQWAEFYVIIYRIMCTVVFTDVM